MDISTLSDETISEMLQLAVMSPVVMAQAAGAARAKTALNGWDGETNPLQLIPDSSYEDNEALSLAWMSGAWFTCACEMEKRGSQPVLKPADDQH